MVCETCQKKLDKVITPEVWKEDPTSKASGRKLNENKLLSKNKKKYQPYGAKGSLYGAKCEVCKEQLHQPGKFCQACAYKKGVCSMCGKQILDIKGYKQSAK